MMMPRILIVACWSRLPSLVVLDSQGCHTSPKRRVCGSCLRTAVCGGQSSRRNYGGGQLRQSIGWGGSDQSVQVTDSRVRVTHKILLFGHLVIQQTHLPFSTPGAEIKGLLWVGQGTSNI